MDCSDIQQEFSPYFDRELCQTLERLVSQHVARCHECAAQLAAFGVLSSMARNLRTHPVPSGGWEAIAAQSHLAATHGGAEHSPLLRRVRSNWMFQLILVVAILVAVGVSWRLQRSAPPVHEATAFAVHFSDYLAGFRQDPHAAQKLLLARYEKNRAVTPEEGAARVGYAPAVTRDPPEGYQLVSTHVLSMPCCTCVQSLCKRSDGTILAIFEHDAREEIGNAWFRDRTTLSTQCRGKQCSLVIVDGQLAATWEHQSRHIILIGVTDIDEISQFVAWLENA